MVRGKANSVCIVLSDIDEDCEEEDSQEGEEDEYSQEEEEDDDDDKSSNTSFSSSDEIIGLSDDEEDEEEEESINDDKNGDSVRSNTVYDEKAQYDRILQLLKDEDCEEEDSQEGEEDEYSQEEEEDDDDDKSSNTSSSSSDEIIGLSDDEEDEEEEESINDDKNGDSVRSNTVYDEKAQYDRILQLLKDEDCEEEDSQEGEEDEYSQEEEEDDDDDDDDKSSNTSSSSSDEIIGLSDDEEDEEEEESINDDKNGDSVRSNTVYDEKAQYDRILQLLKGGRDMEPLKLEECKVYLRKHRLRLTGNKEVCIQRIQEHWRIKDGNGEKLYPRSSFSINCTGDVCKGDVVVFKQRVFGKFDKVTRSRNLRTIAGRVVMESYGTAKQQHTFTVEVLWSKGYKKLPPLSPMLVKGRILYRLRTYRQRWDNEAERSKVLAEKHKRGAAARELRARKRTCSENKGSKRKKHSHHTGGSPKRRRNQEPGSTSRTQTRKHDDSHGKASLLNQPKPKENEKHQVQKTFPKHFRPNQSNTEMRIPAPRHYSNATSVPVLRQELHNHRRPGHNAYAIPPPMHYQNTTEMPILQEYNHSSVGHYAYGVPGYHLDPRSLSHHRQIPYNRQIPFIPLRPGHYSGSLRCSTPGCGELQTENCVVFSCWRCCGRTGRRCIRHQN